MTPEELSLQIARCSNVRSALADSRHPCSRVVGTQCDTTDRQLPEPWFGNIAGARLVFVSSNPSIDDAPGGEGEDYPVAGWSDERVARWFVDRVAPGCERPAVSYQTPGVKNFFVLCRDGSYRGFQKNRSKPQLTWANTHRVAQEILGEEAHPGVNYAITEVVHCKSKNAVGVKQAAMTCSEKWLDRIMHLAGSCNVVVLSGAQVRDNWARRFFAEVPVGFGRRANGEEGAAVAARDLFVSSQLGGRRMLFVYLPHAASMEPGGRRLPESRFGPVVARLISDVANQKVEIPDSNEALQRLIAAT